MIKIHYLLYKCKRKRLYFWHRETQFEIRKLLCFISANIENV